MAVNQLTKRDGSYAALPGTAITEGELSAAVDPLALRVLDLEGTTATQTIALNASFDVVATRAALGTGSEWRLDVSITDEGTMQGQHNSATIVASGATGQILVKTADTASSIQFSTDAAAETGGAVSEVIGATKVQISNRGDASAAFAYTLRRIH